VDLTISGDTRTREHEVDQPIGKSFLKGITGTIFGRCACGELLHLNGDVRLVL